MTKGSKRRRNPSKLSTLDDFLAEDGRREEFEAVAVKEVLAWQISEAMKASKLSQNGLAQRMKTSRSQVDKFSCQAAWKLAMQGYGGHARR